MRLVRRAAGESESRWDPAAREIDPDNRALQRALEAHVRQHAARSSDATPDEGSGATFSVGIEAFRMLRTSLLWCEQGDSMKTLVVTSAAPGEGKAGGSP